MLMQDGDDARKETPTAANRAGMPTRGDVMPEEWAKYAGPHQNRAIYQGRRSSGTLAAT